MQLILFMNMEKLMLNIKFTYDLLKFCLGYSNFEQKINDSIVKIHKIDEQLPTLIQNIKELKQELLDLKQEKNNE